MSWMTPLKCIGLSSARNTDRSSKVRSEEADPAPEDGVCRRNLVSTGDGSTCKIERSWVHVLDMGTQINMGYSNDYIHDRSFETDSPGQR